jgi:HPt (histidine-containing phosphotransfer) domain-containing protein
MESRPMEAHDVMPASSGHTAPHARIFDPGVLRSILGDNPEVVARLLGRYFEALDNDVADLEAAILRRRLVDLRYRAHRILGAALSVGAQELVEVIEQLGKVARGRDWGKTADELRALHAAISRLRMLLRQG